MPTPFAFAAIIPPQAAIVETILPAAPVGAIINRPPVGAITNRPKCGSVSLYVEWCGVGLRYVFALTRSKRQHPTARAVSNRPYVCAAICRPRRPRRSWCSGRVTVICKASFSKYGTAYQTMIYPFLQGGRKYA